MKTLTLGSIIARVLGACIFLGALQNLFQGELFVAFIGFVLGTFIFPPASRFFEKNIGFRLSFGVKCVVVLALVALWGKTNNATTPKEKNRQVAEISDTAQTASKTKSAKASVKPGLSKKDLKKSHQACDSGDLSACVLLGALLHEQDKISEAVPFFKRACDGGTLVGCYFLGGSENELGNKNEAMHIYDKSCNAGHMNSCSVLGLMEQEKGNNTRATELFKKSCTGGSADGCDSLGDLAKSQNKQIEANRFYHQACDGGEQGACDKLKTLNLSQSLSAESNSVMPVEQVDANVVSSKKSRNRTVAKIDGVEKAKDDNTEGDVRVKEWWINQNRHCRVSQQTPRDFKQANPNCTDAAFIDSVHHRVFLMCCDPNGNPLTQTCPLVVFASSEEICESTFAKVH
jgi:TPR repeat protein